jgi:hypothetical protein
VNEHVGCLVQVGKKDKKQSDSVLCLNYDQIIIIILIIIIICDNDQAQFHSC